MRLVLECTSSVIVQKVELLVSPFDGVSKVVGKGGFVEEPLIDPGAVKVFPEVVS
jgi:hypothetical protein